MTEEKAPKSKTKYAVTEEREKALDGFEVEDPYAKRFFMFFDMLRLRGVDSGQSARTAHLVASGLHPYSTEYLK